MTIQPSFESEQQVVEQHTMNMIEEFNISFGSQIEKMALEMKMENGKGLLLVNLDSMKNNINELDMSYHIYESLDPSLKEVIDESSNEENRVYFYILMLNNKTKICKKYI
jgi:hypothetical protein